MINIVFKNLESSELARDAVREKLAGPLEKFPDLEDHRTTVTLSMENSPHQAGPDLFTVKIFIRGAKYGELVVEKSSPSLYLALADLAEHLLEKLNRTGDRQRVRSRKVALKRSAPVIPSN